jgi:hypothetical protein
MPSSALPDAGSDAALASDAGPPPRPPRADAGPGFAQCASNDDCAEGEICNFDFPQGLCTPRCTTDADCPFDGACIPELDACLPRCALGSGSCGPDQLCIAPGLCVASCSPREDATEQACSGDLVCLRNFCEPDRVVSGAPVGTPCTRAGDCASGRCATDVNDRFPDGSCTQLMRVLPDSAWFEPGPMPSGGCLDEHALLPGPGALEGDAGHCQPR